MTRTKASKSINTFKPVIKQYDNHTYYQIIGSNKTLTYWISDTAQAVISDRQLKDGSIKTYSVAIFKNKNGQGMEYTKCGLSLTGSSKVYRFHRLLWSAVNGPIPSGLDVEHIDQNTDNNRLSNLQAVSHAKNCQNKKNCKLNEYLVIGLIKKLADGTSVRTVAKELSVSPTLIHRIKAGEVWSSITGIQAK